MRLPWLNRIAVPGGFLRSAMVLVSGTAFAHAITALALPVLTRLYSPADFSLLAVFSSLLAIISVAACLRLDVAIALPEDDFEAFNLLVLSLGSAVGISLALGAVVLIAPAWVVSVVGRPDLEPYFWLLPIGVVLAGAYSALQNWFVRKKQFSLIARSRVIQSAVSAGTQIGSAGLSIAPFGLLAGYLLNTGAACVGLGYRLFGDGRSRQNASGMSWATLKRTLGNYSRFPKYSTWEALCNSAAIQVPIIMIGALASSSEAGFILLAMSVIQAPMALFGTAIGQVYLSRAPDEYRHGRLGTFTAAVLTGLIKGGVGPLLAIGILSPVFFGALFGVGWDRAGTIVAWMTPWFILQFLASPISMALHVTRHQRAVAALQILGLAFRVLAVWLSAQFNSSRISEAYALSGFAFYSAYLWLILRCVKTGRKQLMDGIFDSIGILTAWALGGALLAVAGHLLLTTRTVG